MPDEVIQRKLNDFLWKMNQITPIPPDLEMKLKLAFQEGVIQTSEYYIDLIKMNFLKK